MDPFLSVSSYFSDVITKDYNLRNFVEGLEALDNKMKHTIFKLHNEGCGKNLYIYLQELARAEKIDSSKIDKIYALSLSWPVGLKI